MNIFNKKWLFGSIFVIIAVLGFNFFHASRKVINEANPSGQISKPVTPSENANAQTGTRISTENDENGENFEDAVIYDVPFTSQAPHGKWGDLLYQDGCEEASVLMVARWSRGIVSDIGKDEADRELKRIAEYEKNKFGHYIDTSTEDTAEVLKTYFKVEKVSVKKNVSEEDIRMEIRKGNLVIVPTDGRKLGNPYYTAPGPQVHMLVIIGYDPDAKEYITNDPGTRRGEGYRYKDKVLYGAISDYTTGDENRNNLKRTGKNIIIVGKS